MTGNGSFGITVSKVDNTKYGQNRTRKETMKKMAIFLFPCLLSLASADFFKNVAFPKEMDPQLALLGTSRVQAGKPLDLQIVAIGKNGDPCEMPAPPVVFCEGPQSPNSTDQPPCVTIEFQQTKPGIFHPASPPILPEEGYYLLTAKDPNGVFLPFGLPVHAGREAPRRLLHWGDLHGHSSLSDGARTPEEYYRWARDVAGLDMIALTDHNWALNDEKIEKLKKLADEWYKPGKFVPFLGFEWARGERRPAPSQGRPDHKHLIFRRTDEDLHPWMPLWHNTPTVEKLWEMLEGRDVIAIPHHTGLPHKTHFGTDWSGHSEKFERLAEIFSDWGSSEAPGDRYQLPQVEEGNFIQDALNMGYHMGFAGGSDTHTSRPGLNTIPHQGHPYPLTALTAVEATTRTRDALWLGLYNRRCYATSAGRRHILEFTLDGSPMGSRLAQPVRLSPRVLKAELAGSTNIREIVFFKNGKAAAKFPGNGWCRKIEWIDREPGPKGEDYYYVRAEMEDSSMAWSSPIWVAGPDDPDIAAGPRLWRLDGDVSLRKMQMKVTEKSGISHEKPLTLCDIRGAGAIDRILIDALSGDSEKDIRNSVLTVWIDDESTPGIRTYLDQFYFIAMGGKPYVTRGAAFSCRKKGNDQWLLLSRDLRIPFSRSCRIRIIPPPGGTIPEIRTEVTYGLWDGGRLPRLGRMGRCRIQSLREHKVRGTGTEVQILDIEGRGLYHSLQIAMCNRDSGGQYMEGNFEFLVDGEKKAEYASSGTEGFLLGGIYYINPFITPDAGCTLSIHEPGNTERATSAFRIFFKDPILFDKSLRIIWHNGQPGQGEVKGTTTLDVQSVVYLQREEEEKSNIEDAKAEDVTRRLNLLDGDPEQGPMKTHSEMVPLIEPGGTEKISEFSGAGRLCRVHLSITGDPERSSHARIHIFRDGEEICNEPLGLFFGSGGISHNFTTAIAGQTLDPSRGLTYFQRGLLIPHKKSIAVFLEANRESGAVEGEIHIERRCSRSELPADFGNTQAPLFLYGKSRVNEKTKRYTLVDMQSERGGEIREIGLCFTGIAQGITEIPVVLKMKADQDVQASWRPHTLAAGLDNGDQGAFAISDAFCLRKGEKWSGMVSLDRSPFAFHHFFALEMETLEPAPGITVEAHILVGRPEPGPVRTGDISELAGRLTGLDGGVPAGRAILRYMEDGEIDPGKTATLLDLPGRGTLRCLRIGTPGSADALRRSHLSIRTDPGSSSPMVRTPTEHLFATWFDPFPFWEGAENIVCPSQLHRKKGGNHTSAFRLLNLPFDGKCRVSIEAPQDTEGLMQWLEKNSPGKTLRQVFDNEEDYPADILASLRQCTDVGLFIMVFANRVDRNLDWGRFAVPRFASVEGVALEPGGAVALAEVSGKGALTGIQMAVEQPDSPDLCFFPIEIYIDGEESPSWRASDLGRLFLGTPLPGSGEGKQIWEKAKTRGRGAVGSGNRLISSEAGTTIFTSSPPYRFGGWRSFKRNAITFEKSIRVVCRNQKKEGAPVRLWSLAILSTSEAND